MYTTLIHHFLEESAQRHPDKIAVIHGAAKATYSEIEEKANKLANGLKELKIEKGDRVVILLENSIEYIITYYGILKAGAIVVSLFSTTDNKNLTHIFNECQPKALITDKKTWQRVRNADALSKDIYLKKIILSDDKNIVEENIAQQLFSWRSLVNSLSASQPNIGCIDCDVAAIIYTSGSTGSPRGATLTHLNIISNTNSIVDYLELTSNDRIMVVLPFPYVYGKSLLNTHFRVGGSVVIDNRFTFSNLVLDTMKKEQATGFSGVPSTFAILLNKSSIRDYEFENLRYITQAGGAMAPAYIQEVMKVFSKQKVFIMYGATEASARLSYLDPNDLPRKIGSIGKAIPNVELKIIKENGEIAKQGEIGEIVARGSNIMQGYWNCPEETRKVLTEHGFHTGDLGKIDDEGFFYVVGRKKDMIKAGAHRISAKEIEETLLEHEKIHQVAVIGVEDEILGEAIKAFIVLKDSCDLSKEEIFEFCREKLPEYKVPKHIEFRKNLPQNKSGKILKEKLKIENIQN